MKVVVHYPEFEYDRSEFEKRVADIRAFLLVERLKRLNVSDKTKQDLLNTIINTLRNNT